MPAKTKKPTRNARPARVASKKKPTVLSDKTRLFSGRRFWIIAAVLALFGAIALFRANAATTSPGGQATWQRFPGDPNPRVTGKAYIGADELEATTYKSRFEDTTGKSLSLTRRFMGDFNGNKSGSVTWIDQGVAKVKEDAAANRLPLISFKTPRWADVAAGKYDAKLNELLTKLDSVGTPVWLVIHHEPDGGGSNVGPHAEDDPGGAPAWVSMQKKVRERMRALGTKNIALMAAMTGGFGGDFHQPKDAWWADNTFDAFLLDHYVNTHGDTMANHQYWKGFYQWADKKGIAYGTAELGNRAGGQEGVGYYQATSDCNNLTPRGLPASTVQKSADRIREFWNWGFDNKKDVIAHAYFDKCVNSGSSPWALGGQQLDTWRDIIKNDSRVMRVKDVTTTIPTTPTDPTDSGGGTNTGALAIGIVTPSAGATVSGVTKVNAGPDTNVESVSFRLDGVWQTTDDSAPFSWDWNTVTAANGEHTLTIRARKVGDPGNVYTEKSIKVTVRNATTVPSTPSDTQAPTTPGAVTASLRFDLTKTRYVVDTTWSPSADDIGVSQYQVVRDFTILGNTKTTSFTDTTNLEAGKTYRYSVSAVDGSGKVSQPASVSIKTSCFLIWCSAEIVK